MKTRLLLPVHIIAAPQAVHTWCGPDRRTGSGSVAPQAETTAGAIRVAGMPSESPGRDPAPDHSIPGGAIREGSTPQDPAWRASTLDDPASAASTPDMTAGLSILGETVRHAVDHVECFPAPPGCSKVRFSSEELSSVCPVTGQPDLSSIVIEYGPDRHCIESKSLKLYLWSFRDRAIFAEALAAAVAEEIVTTVEPRWVTVTVTQRPRGGIEIQTTSEMGQPPDEPL